jgi:hypothetical protein
MRDAAELALIRTARPGDVHLPMCSAMLTCAANAATLSYAPFTSKIPRASQ